MKKVTIAHDADGWKPEAKSFTVVLASSDGGAFVDDLAVLVEAAVRKAAERGALKGKEVEVVRATVSPSPSAAAAIAYVDLFSEEGDRVARLRKVPHSYEGIDEAVKSAEDATRLKTEALLEFVEQIMAYAMCYARGDSCHSISDISELCGRVVLFHWSACPYCHKALPQIARASGLWKVGGGKFGIIEVGCEMGAGLWKLVSSAVGKRTVPRMVYFDAQGRPTNVDIEDSKAPSDTMLEAMVDAREKAGEGEEGQ